MGGSAFRASKIAFCAKSEQKRSSKDGPPGRPTDQMACSAVRCSTRTKYPHFSPADGSFLFFSECLMVRSDLRQVSTSQCVVCVRVCARVCWATLLTGLRFKDERAGSKDDTDYSLQVMYMAFSLFPITYSSIRVKPRPWFELLAIITTSAAVVILGDQLIKRGFTPRLLHSAVK